MLSNDEFVQESIGINSYYLRSVREYCVNVEKSLFQTNKIYMERAEVIAGKIESLGEELMTIGSGRVSQKALDYHIFVTPYTLPMEELTMKIMDVKINTEITKSELNLKAGNVTNASPELIATIESINERAYNITGEFIQLCTEVREKQLNNELFSYTYPDLYETMILTSVLFQSELGRIMEKEKTDPTFSVTYQYHSNDIMRAIATYIYGFCNPANKDVIDEARDFILQFRARNEIYKNTPLTPENQTEMTNDEIVLVKRFQGFLERILQGVLDKRYHFIVAPIFIDNVYTEVNFFLYILSFYHETESESKIF